MKIQNFATRMVESFSHGMKNAVVRYPYACLMILLLSGVMIYDSLNHGELLADEIGVTAYYCITAALIDITLRLWRESRELKRDVAILVFVVCQALLFAHALYLWHVTPLCLPNMLPCWAIAGAITVALVYVPFRKEKTDAAMWNFVKSLIFGGIQCFCIGILLFIALMLLVHSLDFLFKISWANEAMSVVLIISMLTVPAFLMLTRIPSGEEKCRREFTPMTFLKATVRYLFIPVTLLYLLVLYIYALKIIIAWQLPDGNVGLPVSILAVSSILLGIVLYPSLREKGNKLEHYFVRFIPFLVLPLLVLMTIAIVRRISDYGISVSRLYAATLNLWLYAVALVVIFQKTRRIHWIAISAAVVMVLTTCLPINYCTLTKNYVSSKIDKLINEYKPKELPIKTSEDFEDWTASIPETSADEIEENIQYIQQTFGDKEAHKWVSFDNFMYTGPREKSKFITFSCKDDTYKIPQGYDRFVSFHDYEPTFTTDSKGRKLVTLHYNDKDSATFAFNCDAFKTEKEVWLTSTDNKHVCCIKYAHIKLDNLSESVFDGGIFYKK